MINLPIYHHDNIIRQLRELEVDVEWESVPIKIMTFMVINAFGEYQEGDFKCSIIYSNNMTFLCPYTYNTLRSIIELKS